MIGATAGFVPFGGGQVLDDLIARANKYAISAGRTGEGQYRAAERSERLGQWLSWTSTVLGAAVGTSIFAEWVETYPIQVGLAAIVAAALSAVQRVHHILTVPRTLICLGQIPQRCRVIGLEFRG